MTIEKLRYFLPHEIQSFSVLTWRLGMKMPTYQVSLIESMRVITHTQLLLTIARNSEYSESLDSEVSMSKTDDFEKE